MELNELLAKRNEVINLYKEYHAKVDEQIQQSVDYLRKFINEKCEFHLFYKGKKVIVNDVRIVHDGENYYMIIFKSNIDSKEMAHFTPVTDEAKALFNAAQKLGGVLNYGQII